MTEFELRPSDVRSDHSAKLATTTALLPYIGGFEPATSRSEVSPFNHKITAAP